MSKFCELHQTSTLIKKLNVSTNCVHIRHCIVLTKSLNRLNHLIKLRVALEFYQKLEYSKCVKKVQDFRLTQLFVFA